MSRARSFRAHIGGDDQQRRAAMAGAGLEEILSELFCNGRRAGASRIDVLRMGDNVTVRDDGSGCASPEALVSFGRADWGEPGTDETLEGCGFHLLGARERVDVTSTFAPRESDASGTGERRRWTMRLTPRGFAGLEEVSVTEDDEVADRHATGLSVTLTLRPDETPAAAREAAEKAALYLPLPVRFNSEELRRESLLSHCARVETIAGVRYGVRRAKEERRETTINVFGRTLHHRPTPRLETRWPGDHWWILAEVVEGRGFGISHDGRPHLLRTPEVEALWRNGQRLLFETVRNQGGPATVVSPSDEEISIACGAHIRSDHRHLARWTPRIDPRAEQHEVPENGLLIAMPGEIAHADRCVLAQALEGAGLDGIAFEEDARHRNEAWYAELRRLTDFSITVRDGDRTQTLEPGRDRDEGHADREADGIDVRMVIRSANGRQETIETAVDIAWRNPRGGCWPYNCGTIVSKALGPTRPAWGREPATPPTRWASPGGSGYRKGPEGNGTRPGSRRRENIDQTRSVQPYARRDAVGRGTPDARADEARAR